MSKGFTTVFAVYDNMTHLDFTGPHQVLCRLPGAQTMIASRDGGDVVAEGNLVIGHTGKLADIDTVTSFACPEASRQHRSLWTRRLSPRCAVSARGQLM